MIIVFGAVFLLTIPSTSQGNPPLLPLVPYPQHVDLLESPPAVIDPRLFKFTTLSKSYLLQEVILLLTLISSFVHLKLYSILMHDCIPTDSYELYSLYSDETIRNENGTPPTSLYQIFRYPLHSSHGIMSGV